MTGAGDIVARFFVPGIPLAKGNHAAFPIARGRCTNCKPGLQCKRRNCFGGTIVGAVVSDDNRDELKAWEAMVRAHAISCRNAIGWTLLPKPVPIDATTLFLMPRPKGHYTSKGALSADGLRNPSPTTRPDFDKLVRAAIDPLTGVLWEDDSQVIAGDVVKLWARDKPGVIIVVRRCTIATLAALDEAEMLGIQVDAGQYQRQMLA